MERIAGWWLGLMCAAALAIGSEPTADPAASSDRLADPATELVTELFQPTATTDEDAKPLRLQEVLARTSDRRQQIELTYTYWILTAKQAALGQRRRELLRLEQLAEYVGQKQPDARSATLLQTAIKSAQAAVSEEDTMVRQSRDDLARQLGWQSNAQPVAIDYPHAGNYQTHFERIFAHGVAPQQAALLARTLPIRRQAVEARAAAVRASTELANSGWQDFSEGKATLTSVLQQERDLGLHERAFLRAIQEYNCEIAAYALPIAQPNAAPSVLVSMLIKPASGESTSSTTAAKPARTAAPALSSRPRM